ncbi:hypothetical protein ZEAMMB73_Zm00001d029577, partial [Zea mays]
PHPSFHPPSGQGITLHTTTTTPPPPPPSGIVSTAWLNQLLCSCSIDPTSLAPIPPGSHFHPDDGGDDRHARGHGAARAGAGPGGLRRSKGRREAEVHRGDDLRRRRRAGARPGRDPGQERRDRVPRPLRPRRRHGPRRLPRQGARRHLRGPAARHPAHRQRGPLAHPLRASHLRVPHQLWDFGRRAQADELLQERALQEPAVRPVPRLHEPHGGHPVRRRVPEHVRADGVRAVPAPRRAPRGRRLRVGPAARHPLPAAALGAARRRHRVRVADPARGRPVRPGRRRARAPRGPGAGALRPRRVLPRRLGGHRHPRVAQHPVPGRDRHRRDAAVHPHPGVLQRRPPHGVHNVRLLRVLLRAEPPAHVPPVGGVLHHHAQHGLLRVPPRGRGERRGPRRRGAAGGPGPRGGRARVRAGDHHVRGAVPVPRRRHPARGRLPQRGAAVPVRAPQERAAVHRVRQDRRGGAAARRGPRVGAAPRALRRRRGGGGVHEPRLHPQHPGPLRHLLGAAGHHQGQQAGGGAGRGGRRAGALLPGDGGGAQLGVSTEPRGGRIHRAAGDPGGPVGHVRGAHGLRHFPRRVHQPVQGAPLRLLPAHRGAARLPRRVAPLQPGAAALGASCSPVVRLDRGAASRSPLDWSHLVVVAAAALAFVFFFWSCQAGQ